ncbi:MAG: cystathionine gamma-lyase [Gammaproteobacteria bacterium]|nr:cystathionine gamma-lyase [Gammaproteobacteria bacterium]
MTDKSKRPATKLIHAGLAKPKNGEAFMSGPSFASTFHLSGDIDNANYQYGRFHNPTWTALETALEELDGGKSLVFPSGMAAVAAVLTSCVEQGDTILLQNDGYYATRAYAEEFLSKFGVTVITCSTKQLLEQDFNDITLTFIETPSNPLLDVVDIRLLAKKIHACNGILAIDNTTLTPLGQQPLALGADIVMCSGTKALNGHSDVLFGYVASKNEQMIEKIQQWRKLAGNIPGPMETWLVHRGLTSLDMRLERMTANAQVIAEYLLNHSAVKEVRYPGLVNDPSYKTASEQQSNFGFIISFDLVTQANAHQFLANADLIFEATSFGGMHTMAERRARWGTDDVSPGLIRLSVGCESIDDLIADIESALNQK